MKKKMYEIEVTVQNKTVVEKRMWGIMGDAIYGRDLTHAEAWRLIGTIPDKSVTVVVMDVINRIDKNNQEKRANEICTNTERCEPSADSQPA